MTALRSMKLYPKYLLEHLQIHSFCKIFLLVDCNQPQKQKLQLQEVDDTLLHNASWTLNYMEQTWAQTKDATS